MARSLDAPGERLRSLWRRLEPLPGGRRIFSLALGWMVPYTGRLGPVVERFEPGHVRVSLRERRSVRNHLRSVHAMALANLGELATGLALLGALPSDVRGILVGFEIEFLKKARGRLTAECRCVPPQVRGPTDEEVVGSIRDADGDEVARVRARWRLDLRSPTATVGAASATEAP